MVETRNRWHLPLLEHPWLDLEADLASLLVVPVEPGSPPFLEVRRRLGHGAHVDVHGRNGKTIVRVAAVDESFMKLWSDPSLIVHVPTNVHGRVHTHGGRVQAKGLRGCALELLAEGGAITAWELSGHLRLVTHAGKIEGTDLSGALDVESSAGAVRLSINALDPGVHRVRTNVGALRVDLARGMSVRVDAHTEVGQTRVDFPSTEHAAAVLELHADVGAIRVRERVIPRPIEATPIPSDRGAPYRSAATSPQWSADNTELSRILSMVEAGKLSAREATELLATLGL